ncbi:ATP synthase F1 subunit gamma [Clostridium sp. MSJ-11]|uniref:ATP synthase gamma chain n=1 Tax=Clostridium mobile TaxID=2841512 RepID=A0ABS6ELW8_9CLOT|nr:ATP synthase F1 subunit gamma [Clostridium mobile]MBU5486117.1 ATP synthase F1 subunit gamma [Clostridium mobile]
MGVSNLNNIRRRMKSITSIQKISKAMSLVATSKFRKVKVQLEANKNYKTYMNDIMEDIISSMNENNPYSIKREKGRNIYLIITSNLGLCGSYNVNVFNEAMKNVDKEEEKPIFVVVGEKGKVFFNKRDMEIETKYLEIKDEIKHEEVKNISKLLMDMYQVKEVKNVYAIYTEFISTGKQVVNTEKLFPIEIVNNEVKEQYMELEFCSDEIFEEALELYINEKLIYILLTSKTSEQTSRMTTMDGATKNAKDILDELSREYNRIRQSSITEELSEIIGGAEVQR